MERREIDSQTPEHLLKYWPRVRINKDQLSLSGVHHRIDPLRKYMERGKSGSFHNLLSTTSQDKEYRKVKEGGYICDAEAQVNPQIFQR
jgi:hypothetical protein